MTIYLIDIFILLFLIAVLFVSCIIFFVKNYVIKKRQFTVVKATIFSRTHVEVTVLIDEVNYNDGKTTEKLVVPYVYDLEVGDIIFFTVEGPKFQYINEFNSIITCQNITTNKIITTPGIDVWKFRLFEEVKGTFDGKVFTVIKPKRKNRIVNPT